MKSDEIKITTFLIQSQNPCRSRLLFSSLEKVPSNLFPCLFVILDFCRIEGSEKEGFRKKLDKTGPINRKWKKKD